MSPILLAVWLSFVSAYVTVPHRTIDRCAQDGAYFYALDDDPTKPIRVERDGVAVRIERHDPKSTEAVISFQRDDRILVQKQKDFEAAQGWLTVSHPGRLLQRGMRMHRARKRSSFEWSPTEALSKTRH